MRCFYQATYAAFVVVHVRQTIELAGLLGVQAISERMVDDVLKVILVACRSFIQWSHHHHRWTVSTGAVVLGNHDFV